MCNLQGTLERRIFDKYVDPLDGKIRCRQLETVLLDMHTEAANEMDAAEEKASGDAPKASKKAEFDPQDAREAEEALGALVRANNLGHVKANPIRRTTPPPTPGARRTRLTPANACCCCLRAAVAGKRRPFLRLRGRGVGV